ncbi:MAG TPA: N-acetylneuraminate synthase family protein [Opitutaceae bacterium]|nr:N-acetylneuraminate synthase family protein [Opitutaceae bacterium]
MQRQLIINQTAINDLSDCYVIAEIGHNHMGRLDVCKEMFKVAKECGANAVKLQKRDNRSLFTKALYNQVYDNPNSYGATYGEHREALEFGEREYQELKALADELKITFFSTAFDHKSADFLAALDMPLYKLASGDLRNLPLLKHVARFQKPLILSTGGGTLDDVRRAYDAIMPINRQLAILQCTAAYPCDFADLNLRFIETLRGEFPDCVIGLSDHDNGIAMSLPAYVLGARIIEKHFTLNRANKGTDHAFSLEPVGLRKMVRDLRRTRLALGDGIKRIYTQEAKPLQKMAKSIYAGRNLPAGTVITEADLAFKCPSGDGLEPFQVDLLVGRKLKQDVAEDQLVLLKHLVD